MAKPAPVGTRIKIGDVEVILRPQPLAGKIPDAKIRSAVEKVVTREQRDKFRKR